MRERGSEGRKLRELVRKVESARGSKGECGKELANVRARM